MDLLNLLEGIEYKIIKGDLNHDISDVIYNTKYAVKDCLFVAIIGTTSDSHDFIKDAIEKGANTIVIEKDVEINEDVTVIRVESSRLALAKMSATYFGNPANDLITIGLTGTKGKTSTTFMIKAILETAGNKVGLIGTTGALVGDKKLPTKNTTPESYELQKLFRQMVDEGCKYVVMEVASQGLKMQRVAGINFDYGVFTNISPDHIGPAEHEDFEEYLYCKSLLFKQCKVGIINKDASRWEDVIKNHTCKIETYAIEAKDADLIASNLEFISEKNFFGVTFDLTGKLNTHIRTGVPGRFSVYNSLVAIAICNDLGIELECIKKALETVTVRGRMESVNVSDKYKIIIDYAHNEISMESLMQTIEEYNHKRVVCIFGGGGNRSKLRRYAMGEIGGKMADLCIITEDNPRFEEIADINEDIKVGLNKSNSNYIMIDDRKEAIRYAMEKAEEGDLILLIGKGHEDYQEIKGVKYPFNEREIILEIARELYG